MRYKEVFITAAILGVGITAAVTTKPDTQSESAVRPFINFSPSPEVQMPAPQQPTEEPTKPLEPKDQETGPTQEEVQTPTPEQKPIPEARPDLPDSEKVTSLSL